MLTAGCASTAPPSERERATQPAAYESYHEAEVENQLRNKLARWDGVPHRWGGTTRQGVDCSGMLYVWYPALFDVRLPRTTSDQVRTGEQVRRNNLRSGDLVFFQTSRKGQHVGVYLNDGEFAHASTSNGVMTSSLDEPYWRERYWTARRVLHVEASPRPLHAERDLEDQIQHAPRDRPRTGW